MIPRDPAPDVANLYDFHESAMNPSAGDIRDTQPVYMWLLRGLIGGVGLLTRVHKALGRWPDDIRPILRDLGERLLDMADGRHE